MPYIHGRQVSQVALGIASRDIRPGWIVSDSTSRLHEFPSNTALTTVSKRSFEKVLIIISIDYK